MNMKATDITKFYEIPKELFDKYYHKYAHTENFKMIEAVDKVRFFINKKLYKKLFNEN